MGEMRGQRRLVEAGTVLEGADNKRLCIGMGFALALAGVAVWIAVSVRLP